MGSASIEVIPPDSLDRWGLSVTTTTRDGDDPRTGSIYHPARFAAASPVYFHPVVGSRFLGLFDGYWKNATAAAAAGLYSAHTAVAAPAAAFIDASTGELSRVPGLTDWDLIPTGGALISACSQSRVLYLLIDVNDATVVSVWRLDPTDALVFMRSTVVPSYSAVVFDRGIYLDGPYLYLWGTDDADVVYTARVFTSKLGIDPWAYQSDVGWSSEHAPTPVPGLISKGPMSTAVFRKRTYVSAVGLNAGNYVGQIWCSRSMSEPWTKLTEVSIAAIADWAGNNLMLQPQVSVNNAAVPDTAIGALPYVLTRPDEGSGTEGLRVSWDLLMIPYAMV